MTISKRVHSPINSITLLVILLVSMETIICQDVEDESIRDNSQLPRLRSRGRVLRAFIRPTNLSTAPYFGKRKDNLVTLRNVHLERQSRRYWLHWFLELAQKYPGIAREYEWTVLNGKGNGQSSTSLFTSIEVP